MIILATTTLETRKFMNKEGLYMDNKSAKNVNWSSYMKNILIGFL